MTASKEARDLYDTIVYQCDGIDGKKGKRVASDYRRQAIELLNDDDIDGLRALMHKLTRKGW